MAEKPLVTIYGFGYVGKAIVRFLKDNYALQIVDPQPVFAGADDLKDLSIVRNPEKIQHTDFAIICVPTPMGEDGSCDFSIVQSLVQSCRDKHKHILLKSTVVPGTTDYLNLRYGTNIVFSPEFIGEGKYEIPFWTGYPHPTNMKLHPFHIFGGAKDETAVWANLWQKIAGWNARYVQTNSRTAELVKYGENAFLATKKVFFDECYELCRHFGVNYHEFRDLLVMDKRVGESMSLIFPDNRGFGGKCLPKDLNAIVHAAREMGYEANLLKEVLRSNKRFREEE